MTGLHKIGLWCNLSGDLPRQMAENGPKGRQVATQNAQNGDLPETYPIAPANAEKKKTAGGSRLQEGVPPSASSEGGAQRIQVIAKR